MRQPNDTAGNGTSRNLYKVSRLKRAAGQKGRNRSKGELTCCGLVMINERDSRVLVQNGW